MTSDAHTGIGKGGFSDGAGAATEQHITGADEEATFTTDEPPTGKTPSGGSSNLGINKLRANRQVTEEQQQQ